MNNRKPSARDNLGMSIMTPSSLTLALRKPNKMQNLYVFCVFLGTEYFQITYLICVIFSEELGKLIEMCLNETWR
jgi:hypothetical protein